MRTESARGNSQQPGPEAPPQGPKGTASDEEARKKDNRERKTECTIDAKAMQGVSNFALIPKNCPRMWKVVHIPRSPEMISN